MTDRAMSIAGLAVGVVGSAASVFSAATSAGAAWWAYLAAIACGIGAGAGFAIGTSLPMWRRIRNLRGVMLGVVKDAYPDGISMAGRSDAEWEAIAQLSERGILATSESGVVTGSTRYSLTVGAMNAISARERRFARL